MTIIFDFDGTIANTLELILKYFNQVSSSYNLSQIDNLEKIKNLSAREILKEFHLSPWKLAKLTMHIRGQLKSSIHNAEIVNGIPLVINKLKKIGHQIGIVTSNSKDNVELFLKHHSLTDIDFIYSEKNLLGKGKVLSNLIKKYQLNKEHVVYVGDEVRDIEAARKAKIAVVGVTWGFNSKERLKKANPDYLISDPQELVTLINKMSA